MRALRLTGIIAASTLLGAGLVPLASSPAAAVPIAPFTAGGLIELHEWSVIAPEWTSAPTIDGDLAESGWATSAVVDGFVTAYAGAPASEPIEYRIGYDDEALYIGGEFSDDEAATLAAVEIVIGAAGSTSDHSVVSVPVASTRVFETDWNNPVLPPEGADRTDVAADSAVDEGPSSTVVEIAIPWEELGTSAPASGDELLLNIVHVHDPGAAPMTSWVPIERARYMDRDGGIVSHAVNLVDQGRWGQVVLGTPAGGDAWSPANTELDFTGLQQKVLSFDQISPAGTDYTVEWKAPDSGWIVLDPPVEANPGTRVTLEFQHPEVREDGTYLVRISAESSAGTSVGVIGFDRRDLIDAGHEAQAFVATAPSGSTPVTPAPASTAVLDIMALIPEQNGMRFVGLPEMPELEADAQFTLAPDGQSMIATRTSTVYPNPSYPETESLTALDRNGNPVVYPYYEDSEDRRYFLSAQLWHLQRVKAVDDTAAIAATDPLGAARLLYRFAETYQNYVPTSDQRWYNFPMDVAGGAPYNYWGGMWNSWSVNDFSTLETLLSVYQTVKQTDAFDVLSLELGIDVDEFLMDDMFLPSFDYVLSYTPTYGNLTFSIWNGLIAMGAATGEPEYVHRAVEWIRTYVESRFLTDGTWYEVTTSYHNQAYKGLVGALTSLAGYTDPVGYISPRTGVRFDDLDLLAEMPVLAAGADFVGLLVYPDGRTLPLQDTWAANRAADPQFDAGALLFPSAGIARTTSGTGLDQAQMYLQFTPKYGHNHYDPLSISYFDQGEELLPDLGYTHSKYYYFTTSTMGHNTVVVDSSDMSPAGSLDGGQIEQFVPDLGPFSVMRASQDGAYSQTSEYNRELWFVNFPGSDDGYSLDVFRVEGGDRHEYTLNGHAGDNAFFSTDLDLTAYGDRLLPPGVVATEAADSSQKGSAEGYYPGYIYVKDVDEADLTGLDQFTVSVETYEPGGGEGPVLDITGLLEDGSNELYLGSSPSITTTRDLGRVGDQNDILEGETMPKLVLRRDGTDLSSTFVTLLEARDPNTAAVVEAVDRLTIDSGPAGAVALQITYGDVTDIVISNTEDPTTELTVGDISMTGELGFIRIADGEIVDMRLINGAELSKGAATILGSGQAVGQIEDTLRVAAGDAANAFVTDTPVPVSAIGRYIVVEHPDGTARGYEISDVVASGGGSIVTLADEDPGFSFTGTQSQLDFYPGTAWTGAHTFTIADRSSLSVSVADAPSTGSISGTVVDASAAPLAGAAVSVSGLPSVTTTTDSAGEYTLTGVPAGVRRVVVAAPGLVPVVSDSALVAASGSATIDVDVLEEVPPMLSGVPAAVGAGAPVPATTSKDADVYLVPGSTPKDAGSIVAAASSDGAEALAATATVPVSLDTTGLADGPYRVYAIDDLGAISASAGVVLVDTDMGEVDDTDPRMVFSSGWRPFENAGHFGGSTKRAYDSGDSVELLFYGSAAVIYAQTTAGSGIADVYVDDVFASTIDTYASTSAFQQPVFSTGTLPEGVHTVRLVVTGTARPAAWDTFVAFDFIEVLQSSDLPPVLSAVSGGPIAAGDDVQATVDEAAEVYLVPQATAADAISVAAAASTSGASASATGGIPVLLDTTGLPTDRYVVYAVDVDGNISVASAPLVVVAPVVGTIQESDPILTYSGTWPTISSSNYSGGTLKRAQSSGAWVDIPFYGSAVQVIGGKNVTNGIANVYIDGVFVGTFDAFNGSALHQQVLFQQTGLTLGAHVLRVEATWTNTSPATNFYVSFDSLISS